MFRVFIVRQIVLIVILKCGTCQYFDQCKAEHVVVYNDPYCSGLKQIIKFYKKYQKYYIQFDLIYQIQKYSNFMINVHSVDGFQVDQSGPYCYLEDSDGNQVGTIEIDELIAHVYMTRSELTSEFDFEDYDQQDDDLVDIINETMFDPLNWIVPTSLIQQMIEIVYCDC